jgi:CO dehydrogenase maturation factor
MTTIALFGKGGVGKTTITTLLIDEIARRSYTGKVLVVDGDPAMTLAMTLRINPPSMTLADLRDNTPLNAREIRNLTPGVSPSQFVLDQLRTRDVIAERQVREMIFDIMVMGHSEGPGCYCSINNALIQALASVRASYDLIIVDNEAGLEHISRYRFDHVDVFLTIMTMGRASWTVANQIKNLAEDLGIKIGRTWPIYNRVGKKDLGSFTADHGAIVLPECDTIVMADRQGGSPTLLAEDHPFRVALVPIIDLMATPAITAAEESLPIKDTFTESQAILLAPIASLPAVNDDGLLIFSTDNEVVPLIDTASMFKTGGTALQPASWPAKEVESLVPANGL